jgi:VWFA-related protein
MLSSLRLALIATLATAGLLQPLPAQPPAHPSHSGSLIRVPVVVRGRHGEWVPHLTASDFTLTDNTHPQVIQSFTPDTRLPLTLGLVFQTGSTQSRTLREKVQASEGFLNSLLAAPVSSAAPKPQAFIIQFNRDVDLLEDPSASERKAHQALDQVGMAQFHRDSNADHASSVTVTRKSRRALDPGATLYDAIYLASTGVLAKTQGRKVLILLGDGIDRGSKTTFNGAVEAAQRAGVAVYAIYFKGGRPPMEFRPINRSIGNSGGYPGSYPGNYPGGYPGGDSGRPSPLPSGEHRVDGRKMLQEICQRTGGELFDSRRQALPRIYAALMQQLNHAYTLQYMPTKTAAADSGFHHIRLSPKQKHLTIQMTEGYWIGAK